MHNDRDHDRETVFHERINKLKKEGYRGFTIASEAGSEWEIKITATDPAGKVLTSGGETKEEAFNKMIDLIDNVLDG